MSNVIITRHKYEAHLPSMLKEIYVERGTKEDWEMFRNLHYKADDVGIGPKFYRIVFKDRPIGVAVTTVPKMLLAGRNELFKHLKPNSIDGRDSRMINKYRAEWINANSTINSRLVIDQNFRGVGFGYRAQNLILRMTNVPIIEFQSSMSKFNVFAEKAGVKFTRPRKATYHDKGMLFFRSRFEADPQDFVGILAELEAMPKYLQKRMIQDMRDFYYQHSAQEKSGNNRMNGTSRVDGLTVSRLIKSIHQLVFASPLYGVYFNPDASYIKPHEERLPSHLPEKIPLLAFENQAVDEPMNMEKLTAMLKRGF